MATCAVWASLAGGCASRPPSDFTFPASFRAQQIVRVDLPDRSETFVAVLDRRPEALDVTLLEPLFLAPVVRVSRRDDRTEARWFVEPGGPEGARRARAMPERLVALLDAIYGDARWTADARTGECRAHALPFDATLSGVPAADAGPCRFPAVIDIAFRMGPAKAVRVETRDVECAAEAASP